MKKAILFLLFVAFLFAFNACSSRREYVVSGTYLQSAEVEDNYRVYYEIFVGSFSDSNDDGIGDIPGMTIRLDYLNDGDPNSGKSLGIQGIWLMPIMPSPSYHKYDVTDYKNIDPKYGTLDDFSAFVADCHSRGVDVIIDLVLNHTSNQHPWFKAALSAVKAGDMHNQYVDYYSIVTADQKLPGSTYYLLYGDYYYEANFSSSMPELNMDSDAVKNEIKDIIAFWYDLGVDGFRLDAAKYIYYNDTPKNIAFWDWFSAECKKINPDTFLIGEVWSADPQIEPYYECFSNFDFGMSQSSGAIATVANNYDDVNWYVYYLNSYRNSVEAVNPDAILAPFISNHDMNRAAGYLSVPDYNMYVAASLYIWTYGAPFIYYGEEIGMKGVRTTENTDANRRLKMLWGDKDTVKDPIGATYSPENQTNGTVRSQIGKSDSLLNHYKKLIMIRNANPEIARGVYTVLQFAGYSTFGGFLSTYQDSTVGIFHNTGSDPITIDLSQYTDQEFIVVRGFAGMGAATLDGQTLTIGGRTSVVLG